MTTRADLMRLFFVMILTLSITACGKTGDLYLPEDNPPADSGEEAD